MQEKLLIYIEIDVTKIIMKVIFEIFIIFKL
jgi:hypothetical protein